VVKDKGALLHWIIGGVLISLSQAIEPVGGYTTESVTHGQCDVRPMVTFPAAEHHWPMASSKLYCFAQAVVVNESFTDMSLKPIQTTAVCEQHTMNHIVDVRTLTKSEGSLELLNEAEDYAKCKQLVVDYSEYTTCEIKRILNL